MKVRASTIAVLFPCLLITALAAQRGGAGQGAREVTVTAIPGVVAAGVTWRVAWQAELDVLGGGQVFEQRLGLEEDRDRPVLGWQWQKFTARQQQFARLWHQEPGDEVE